MKKKSFLFNKSFKLLLSLIILFLVFVSVNPLRKLITYKTTNVFEDKPLGFYVQEYDDVNEIKISNLHPEDINVEDFVYEKVKYSKHENIINWTLEVDEYFEGHTDVIGICRYTLYVYPTDKVHSSIEIDHQGGACDFWENIKRGDMINVIGEVTASKPIWTEESKLMKYATEYVIEVRPMILKHNNKKYINASLPLSIRMKLLKLI